MKTNYKGFELTYNLDKHGNVTIERADGSITNQIALLTNAIIYDNSLTYDYEIELDYKYDTGNDSIDFGIDVDRWLTTHLDIREQIIVALLQEECIAIAQEIGEVV